MLGAYPKRAYDITEEKMNIRDILIRLKVFIRGIYIKTLLLIEKHNKKGIFYVNGPETLPPPLSCSKTSIHTSHPQTYSHRVAYKTQCWDCPRRDP